MADWKSTQAFYRSEFWIELSRRVRVAARWICADCGHRAINDYQRRRMQAHHVIPRPHVAHPTALDVQSNLTCLCENCHRLRHGFVPEPVAAPRGLPAPRAARASGAARFRAIAAPRARRSTRKRA